MTFRPMLLLFFALVLKSCTFINITSVFSFAAVRINCYFKKTSACMQHNLDYVVFLFLTSKKSQVLNLSAVYFTCFHSINTSGIYARMSEDIRKAYNIFLNGIKCTRKQVPQIMRKYFFPAYICRFTYIFKHFPYIGAVKRFTGFCDKDRAAFYFLMFNVRFQHFT